MSIRFLVREKPSVVAVGSAGERVGRARKVFREPLTRTQSERLHRLALAGWFSVSDYLE